jgi:hypothetical protein
MIFKLENISSGFHWCYGAPRCAVTCLTRIYFVIYITYNNLFNVFLSKSWARTRGQERVVFIFQLQSGVPKLKGKRGFRFPCLPLRLSPISPTAPPPPSPPRSRRLLPPISPIALLPPLLNDQARSTGKQLRCARGSGGDAHGLKPLLNVRSSGSSPSSSHVQIQTELRLPVQIWAFFTALGRRRARPLSSCQSNGVEEAAPISPREQLRGKRTSPFHPIDLSYLCVACADTTHLAVATVCRSQAIAAWVGFPVQITLVLELNVDWICIQRFRFRFQCIFYFMCWPFLASHDRMGACTGVIHSLLPLYCFSIWSDLLYSSSLFCNIQNLCRIFVTYHVEHMSC